MTFPAVPRDVVAELWLNGAWVNVSALGHVRAADGIRITRGQPNEAGQPQPATCSLTLDNRTGHYSPRNPLSPWYGYLGRNTPIRVGVVTAKDGFDRTVSDQWGDTPAGREWFHGWSAGGAFTQFDVNGGSATHAVSAANRWLLTYLPDPPCRDVEVYTTVTPPYADVLGGAITTGITLRGADADDYYLADLWISPTEAMWIRVWRVTNGSFTLIGSQVQLTNFTYTAQQLCLRAQVSGQTLRFKVWPATVSEPYGWSLVTSDDVITAAGGVGVRSDVYSGNTNTMPAVFTYGDFVVQSVRFAGEVSAWPQRWDTTGIDVTAPIEASSVLRRLGQGSAPQLSTLYRAITGLTTPAVAYWPCEEGSDSVSIASAVGGPPMTVVGNTNFAAYNEFPSSYPIPVPQTASTWSGSVPTYTGTGELQLSFITHVPTSQPADLSYFIEMTTENGRTWSLQYHTGGAISLELWEFSTQLLETGPITFNVVNQDVRITLSLEQNGSHIDYEMRVLEASGASGGTWSGTQLNRTVGRALRIRAFPHGEMTGVAMGHISVRKEVTNFWDQARELSAFSGETALERVLRLGDQNRGAEIDFNVTSFGAAVGPQRPLPLLTLLQECADADSSLLLDARTAPEMLYRQLPTMYAQEPTAVLNYSGGQIAPPFQPIDDDQLTRNDISVSRVKGTTARAVLEIGRMSIKAPELGGVGVYTTELEVNVYRDDQLPDIAGWELNKGTVDETRYPVVRVGLHHPAVSVDQNLSRAMLDLDVGDRFQIINPKDSETPDTIDQICLGYTETIGVFDHSIAINAAPASPYRVAVFDDGESRRDTDGSDLTAGISSSATSFQVDTPSGVLWTTDPADMPIPVMVGGEEIAVGSVSGTSSPQTFSSITRSVNGIVKAHNAGTSLSIARPRVLGL